MEKTDGKDNFMFAYTLICSIPVFLFAMAIVVLAVMSITPEQKQCLEFKGIQECTEKDLIYMWQYNHKPFQYACAENKQSESWDLFYFSEDNLDYCGLTD